MVGRSTNFPADGVWTLKKARDEQRADAWPKLTPNAASGISTQVLNDTSANIYYTVGSNATSYGVYWSTSANVTTADTFVSGGTTVTQLTGLAANTTFYYRVAMINSYGATLDASDSTFSTPPTGTTVLSPNTTTNFLHSTYGNLYFYAMLPDNKTVTISVTGGSGAGGGMWNYSGGHGAAGGQAATSFVSGTSQILKLAIGGKGQSHTGQNTSLAYAQAGSGAGAGAVIDNATGNVILVAGGGGGASSAWNNPPQTAGAGGVIASGINGPHTANGGTGDTYHTAATGTAAGTHSQNSTCNGFNQHGGGGASQTSDTASYGSGSTTSAYGDGGLKYGSYYGTGGGGAGGYRGGAGGVYPGSGGGGSSYIASGYTSVTCALTAPAGGGGGASYGAFGADGNHGSIQIVVAA